MDQRGGRKRLAAQGGRSGPADLRASSSQRWPDLRRDAGRWIVSGMDYNAPTWLEAAWNPRWVAATMSSWFTPAKYAFDHRHLNALNPPESTAWPRASGKWPGGGITSIQSIAYAVGGSIRPVDSYAEADGRFEADYGDSGIKPDYPASGRDHVASYRDHTAFRTPASSWPPGLDTGEAMFLRTAVIPMREPAARALGCRGGQGLHDEFIIGPGAAGS